jgi:DNA-binding PadR family transcriptional regulator
MTHIASCEKREFYRAHEPANFELTILKALSTITEPMSPTDILRKFDFQIDACSTRQIAVVNHAAYRLSNQGLVDSPDMYRRHFKKSRRRYVISEKGLRYLAEHNIMVCQNNPSHEVVEAWK